ALLSGQAVSQASDSFDNVWNSGAVVPIAQLDRKPRQKLESVLAAIKEEAGGRVARRYLDRVDLSNNVRAYLAQQLTPYWSDRIRVISDPPLKWKDNPPGDYLVAELFEVVQKTQHKALLISSYCVPYD